MSDYEFGVGEYTMRNGWKAWVQFELPTPTGEGWPLVGYYWDEDEKQYRTHTWRKDGRSLDTLTESPRDLMPPRREWWITYAGPDEWIEGTDSPERKEVLESKADERKLSVVHFVELCPGEKIVSEVNDE